MTEAMAMHLRCSANSKQWMLYLRLLGLLMRRASRRQQALLRMPTFDSGHALASTHGQHQAHK